MGGNITNAMDNGHFPAIGRPLSPPPPTKKHPFELVTSPIQTYRSQQNGPFDIRSCFERARRLS